MAAQNGGGKCLVERFGVPHKDPEENLMKTKGCPALVFETRLEVNI